MSCIIKYLRVSELRRLSRPHRAIHGCLPLDTECCIPEPKYRLAWSAHPGSAPGTCTAASSLKIVLYIVIATAELQRQKTGMVTEYFHCH